METENEFWAVMTTDEMSDGMREMMEAMEATSAETDPVYSMLCAIDDLRLGEVMELAGLLLSLPPSARFRVQIPDAMTARTLLMILSSEERIMKRIDALEQRLLTR